MNSKVANICKNEQFMEDATTALFINRMKAVKTREDDYIWTLPTRKKSTISDDEFSKKQDRSDNYIWSIPTDKMTYVREREIPQKEFEKTNEIGASKKFDTNVGCATKAMCNDVSFQDDHFSSNFTSKPSIRKSEKEASNNYPDGTETSRSEEFHEHHRPVINKSERNFHRNEQTNPNLHHMCKSDTKDTTTKNSFQDWCTQRKVNFNSVGKQQKNDNFLGVDQHHNESITKKRIRHDSGTSIQSKALKQNVQINQKNCPIKQHDANGLTNSMNNMVSIKIMSIGDEKCCYDHTVTMKDLIRIKTKFQKIEEILPKVDQPKREVNYCAVVVKYILGFLFNPYCRLDGKLDGKMTLELLSATRSWEVNMLYNMYQQKFLQNILNENNAKELYTIAHFFHLDELSKACLKACNSKDLSDAGQIRYRLQKCWVSVSTYRESLNFCIPLQETKPTLQDNYERDIKNEIVFKAVSGCYAITGIQIYLECGANTDQRMLNLCYTVENLTEKVLVDDNESKKPVRQTTVIYFIKNLILKPGQEGKITLQTEIEPCFCFVSEDKTVKSPENEFTLSLRSTCKINKSDKKRFLIQKIFYLANPDASAM